MSKKTDQMYAQMMQQLQSYIQKASTPSPAEQQQTTDWNNLTNFLNSKDYRNPTAAGVAVDMLPLTDYQKQSKMLLGGKPVNSTSGAHQQDYLNQKFNQDYGHSYEQQIADLPNQQMGLNSTLQGLSSGRLGMGLQGTQGALAGIANKQPGFDWMQLLQIGDALAGQIPGLFKGSGGSAGGASLGSGAGGII